MLVFGIVALTGEFDLQLRDEVAYTKRIHWLGNVDQLKA
jgi:TPP-dependent 2-oxoacid decarboxylase